MTIQDSEIIDLFHVDNITGEAVLTIVDHLEWDVEMEHLFLLQSKLNSYLAFVESGELLERFPSSKERTVMIQLECLYQPNNTALDFFDKARAVVKNAGFDFKFRHRAS